MVKEQVISLLTQYNGNVDVVATELGISKSYVNRVKKTDWQPQSPTQAIISEVSSDASNVIISTDDLRTLVPTNVAGIANLRDDIIIQIKSKLPDAALKDLIKVLEVLLNYENSIKQLLRPALLVDNRTQNNITINKLVDRLADLDKQQLVELADFPSGVRNGTIDYAGILGE
jgi:hypothetical protein